MELETYLLPDFWANPLINGDITGMSSQDIESMNAWLEETQPGFCVSCSVDESNFTPFHDASKYVLACNCFEFTFTHQ